MALVLLGGGPIGRAVIRKASSKSLPIVGFADSGGAINSSGPIDPEWLIERKQESSTPIGILSTRILPLHKKIILVDCTASDSDEHIDLLLKAVDNDASVVLANKHPVAGDQLLFDKLAPRTRYESAAGACTPFVVALRRLIDAGERVTRIRGCFSGTLGAVSTWIERDGESLADAVERASLAGLTEPDPQEDLSGADVARKAVILARTAGWAMSWDDVDLSPFDETAADLAHPRYVASVDRDSAVVGLENIDDPNDPLHHISGTDNAIAIYTSDVYRDSPLMIRGAGAGANATALGVIADVVEMMRA